MTRIPALLLTLLLFLPPLAATAQELPALYGVVDVAPDDRLNIRAAPSAGAPIVGSLSPTQRGVEVIRLDGPGRWGLINTTEGHGWISMRYVATEPRFPGPPPFQACAGTEPFWALTWDGPDSLSYSAPGGADISLLTQLQTGAPGEQVFGLAATAPSLEASAVIRREICSDGMSDRAYGFSVAVILWQLAGPDGTPAHSLLTGCCRLQAGYAYD